MKGKAAAIRKMHRRFLEQGPQVKNALAVACRIIEGEALEPIEGDHPIYWEIRKDLEKGASGHEKPF